MNELLLQDLLEEKTRKELITLARMLLIKVKSSQTKSEIAGRMTRWILEFPLHLIMQLPPQEVERLRNMVYSINNSMPYNPFHFPDCLDDIGLIDSSRDFIQTLDVIPSDLAKALETVFNSPLNLSSDHDYWYGNHQLILGLINLYGVLSVPEMKELAISFDPKLKNQELDYVINRSFLLKSLKVKIEGYVFFFSPYVEHPMHILEEIDEPLCHALFSRQQVMDAGILGAPIPPENHITARLLKEIGKNYRTGEEKSRMLSEFWMMLNNDHNYLEILKEIKEKFSGNEEELDTMISLVVEWSNHVPRWVQKGNPGTGLNAPSERPHPEEGLRTSVIEQMSSYNPLEDVDRMYEEAMAPEIGPNEPCPCGSGKKYRKCCLKRLRG